MNNQLIHLNNRFAWGLSAKNLKKESKSNFIKRMDHENLKEFDLNFDALRKMVAKKDKVNRKDLRIAAQDKLDELRITWVESILENKAPIKERISFFWHHHFACRIQNPLFAQLFSNAIRKHCIGNFRDLLMEVSQSAAMIDFLHTKQNKKGSPNEDFARELCELFALGRDEEYTENDVKEIARCFTGWMHNQEGQFVFNPKRHDASNKTIFGQTGKFNGEDVINMLLSKKACARFICINFYQYFVHPTPNEKNVNEMTEVFYSSDYDISKLIEHVILSEWFYEEKNQLNRIKSPIELMIFTMRQFKVKYEDKKSLLLILKLLRQSLYEPPNVKGWKVDKEWIDSNSLPLRMLIPSVMTVGKELDVTEKPDYDKNPNADKEIRKWERKLSFSVDWYCFEKDNNIEEIEQLFFLNKLSSTAKTHLDITNYNSLRDKCLDFISLPEYQML